MKMESNQGRQNPRDVPRCIENRPDASNIVPESAPESSKTLPETSKTIPGTLQERTATHHGAADTLQPPTSAKVY